LIWSVERAATTEDLCAGVFTGVLICDSLNLNNGLRNGMSPRRIGQESFGFTVARSQHSSLDELAALIDWIPVDQVWCDFLLCEGSLRSLSGRIDILRAHGGSMKLLEDAWLLRQTDGRQAK
jgi:hypothetical protein